MVETGELFAVVIDIEPLPPPQELTATAMRAVANTLKS